MKKTPKPGPKKAPKTSASSEKSQDVYIRSPIGDAIENFYEDMGQTRTQSGYIESQLEAQRNAGDPVDIQLSSHRMFYSEKMVRHMTEARQIDKHLRETGASMSPEEVDSLVVYHILEMTPPKRRDKIIEELLAATSKGGRGLLS